MSPFVLGFQSFVIVETRRCYHILMIFGILTLGPLENLIINKDDDAGEYLEVGFSHYFYLKNSSKYEMIVEKFESL